MLSYICRTKEGRIVETKNYREAQAIKAAGGYFESRYTYVGDATDKNFKSSAT
jgi:hypothetical protein